MVSIDNGLTLVCVLVHGVSPGDWGLGRQQDQIVMGLRNEFIAERW